MKNLKIFIFLMLLSASASAQIAIIEEVDEMTNKKNYSINHLFVVANDANTKGFTIQTIIKNDENIFFMGGWIVQLYGLGDCNENNEMIFLFEDDTRLVINSFGKFRCKKYTFFMLEDNEKEILKIKKIKKVRFTNGFSKETYTGTPISPNYFINVFNAIESKNNN